MTQASGSTVEESENVGKDWVFTVGDILMIVGAVYAGQLVVEASKCCLRRMRCPPEVDVLRDLQGLQNRGRYDQQGLQNRGRYGQQELQSRGRYDQDIVVVSEDEMAAPERETMSRVTEKGDTIGLRSKLAAINIIAYDDTIGLRCFWKRAYGCFFIGEKATIRLWSIYESKIAFTIGNRWHFQHAECGLRPKE